MPILYTVRYRVAYANGESSPIMFKEVVADNPEEASAEVKRLELQRTDAHPIRSVNVRAVEIVDRAGRRAPKKPANGGGGLIPEPLLRAFPGGGRVTIVHMGRPGPTTFEVAWRNPSSERLQETQAFWKAVNGHVDPFWFDFAGTRYEPCYFEPDSLKIIPTNRDRSGCLVVRFVGTKITGDWPQTLAHAAEQKGD